MAAGGTEEFYLGGTVACRGSGVRELRARGRRAGGRAPRLRRARDLGHPRVVPDARRGRALVFLVPLPVPPRRTRGGLRLAPMAAARSASAASWEVGLSKAAGARSAAARSGPAPAGWSRPPWWWGRPTQGWSRRAWA